ncbi:hypothetical protein [Vibrio cholerae]|nr:hypothetical protein [Vibrio cholerae]EJL6764608.1 hypothetical protein [Vibrio cholerae]EKF9465836.1 hypothetical protein [Vibrio cholerae]EKF9564400.1 hypothetical protein [Vibrio cholerae]MCE3055383.1 hypothetical protein [Vibrio cholerae]HDI3311088.1 hypothetical protein [Vibrio cholerae]
MAAIKRLNVEPEKLRVYQSANEEPEEQNIEAAFATLFAIANNNKAQK